MTRMARKSTVMALAMATTGLLLAGCGGSDNKSTDTTAAASDGTTATTGDGDAQSTDTQGTAPADAIVVGVKVGETNATTMYLTPASTDAPAGPVSFEIVNEGAKEHEFVVLKTDTMAADLEYNAADDKAVEDSYTNVDEVEGIAGGDTATLNVDLEAGHYVLLCNLKGHFKMGMVADFTVS